MNKLKKVRGKTLFVEKFSGDEYDSEAIWISCKTEHIFCSFSEVLFTGRPDTEELARKLVKLWNDSEK